MRVGSQGFSLSMMVLDAGQRHGGGLVCSGMACWKLNSRPMSLEADFLSWVILCVFVVLPIFVVSVGRITKVLHFAPDLEWV